jgi:hypothetical protein
LKTSGKKSWKGATRNMLMVWGLPWSLHLGWADEEKLEILETGDTAMVKTSSEEKDRLALNGLSDRAFPPSDTVGMKSKQLSDRSRFL